MAGFAPRPPSPAPPGAWRHRAARRPAVLWAVALLDAALMLEALGAVAWAAADGSRTVSAGRLEVAAAPAPSMPPDEPQPAPVAVDIPSIGVHASVVGVGIDPTGLLEAPHDFGIAGWWTSGPTPGATGAAVIVGHLDSYRGPAAFFRVPALRPGAGVDVRRADGSTAHFVVDALRQYPKNDLPAGLVYGPTSRPELRLITCGGAFDRRARSYEDNVVVFAHQPDSLETRGVA